ncbi:MAG TPA: Rrf2 family transcriptional regulator [Acidimicrobiales bacterium]
MRVTARVDYAVRSATELALEHPGTLTADTIAARQELPLAFTKQILSAMRRASLVQSHRGGEGGYRLLRPPEAVSVADIVRAVEGPLADVRGEAPETLEYPPSTQVLRPLWIATRASLRAVLETVTLADLAAGKLPRDVEAYTEVAGAWERR